LLLSANETCPLRAQHNHTANFGDKADFDTKNGQKWAPAPLFSAQTSGIIKHVLCGISPSVKIGWPDQEANICFPVGLTDNVCG